ncbi:MAG TPA: hypothetical protein VEA79_02615 [Phenylobacterium sp.]|nr:hypothetical protein [Phenylobacterium sp.]
MQPVLSPALPLSALFRKVWPGVGASRPAPGGAVAPAPAARAERYFMHVRSVHADGARHLFQFALVDDEPNVIASVFASRASPVIGGAPEAVAPDPPTVLWERLDDLLSPCHGAHLVVFGQALQGSLLPYGLRQDVGRMECARERFMKAARRRGLRVRPGDILDLNDARCLAGLPIIRSPDAALQALGLRELWRWMDG